MATLRNGDKCINYLSAHTSRGSLGKKIRVILFEWLTLFAVEAVNCWQGNWILTNTLSAGALIEIEPNAFDEMQSEVMQNVGLQKGKGSPRWPSEWLTRFGRPGKLGAAAEVGESFPGLRDDQPQRCVYMKSLKPEPK